MGNIIEAKWKCGFKSQPIHQGGGFMNFQVIDMEPAICLKCRTLLILNYKKKDQKCPKCGATAVFYNDKSLQRDQSPKIETLESCPGDALDWGDFKLPGTSYLCPNCGRLTMYFCLKGKWD